MTPTTMAAVLLTGHGGLDKLVYRTDVAVPRPADGEVLIEVAAAGIDNTDVNTRIGWYSKTVTSGTSAGGEGFESVGEDLHGIGPSGAARLLVEVGAMIRFPNKAHFASWTGTAPIDASSGDQVRHRLSRAGNRLINRVLHIMARVQIRSPSEGRA